MNQATLPALASLLPGNRDIFLQILIFLPKIPNDLLLKSIIMHIIFPFPFQKVFYANSNKFSRRLAAGGMFRNNTLNVYMEKSIVTGAGNCITSYDRFNFQPSYNVSKPSICD